MWFVRSRGGGNGSGVGEGKELISLTEKRRGEATRGPLTDQDRGSRMAVSPAEGAAEWRSIQSCKTRFRPRLRCSFRQGLAFPSLGSSSGK